jgi:hypothetical protein
MMHRARVPAIEDRDPALGTIVRRTHAREVTERFKSGADARISLAVF